MCWERELARRFIVVVLPSINLHCEIISYFGGTHQKGEELHGIEGIILIMQFEFEEALKVMFGN